MTVRAADVAEAPRLSHVLAVSVYTPAGTLGHETLYGLLVSEDNALVLGSGLLFVILAAIMVITRKVDWYQLGSGRPLAASV